MIRVEELARQYGTVRTVDEVSFEVEPSNVTGFLGPDGSGNFTTMRMVMGLGRPLAGTATVNGVRYSVGMRRRLGVAAALLTDPRVLVFDESVNGLDLDGVRWVGALLRAFARTGRTVLFSTHLMSERQPVADPVVVIGRGRFWWRLLPTDAHRGRA